MSIFDSLFSSIRRRTSFRPAAIPDSETEPPEPTVVRTLLIVYEPTMDRTTRTKLSRYMRWNNVQELSEGYISDVLLVSGGLVRYQIVQRIDVDAFPAKVDGFVYDPDTYLDVVRGIRRPYLPQEADYYAIIRQFGLLERVARDEIDEVWIFNFPHAGFYESIMAGPGAFWCNAPPLKHTEASGRRFVIMGFSYERGVGEMLENLGHRVESIMHKTFERLKGADNLWERFCRYDKINPGNAALGNVHFAPNSDRDYDWNNPSTVLSECDDWLYNFPNFMGVKRAVTASDWGNGDIRQHHRWWLNHLPRTSGRRNGIHNNWWQYIMNPNNVDA
ncbi:MAG TPA: hypothetical protein VFY26_10190 [Anaerolineales bacterium]|nr:hypothetical protein [Anaerolineales bacterium]